MDWWRKATISSPNTRRAARLDRTDPDLLDVWSDPEEQAGTPVAWTAPPHADAASPHDYAQWPTPPTRAPQPDNVSTGALTCIRLNCPEQGRPTVAARCPACGHGTALFRDYRWPHTS